MLYILTLSFLDSQQNLKGCDLVLKYIMLPYIEAIAFSGDAISVMLFVVDSSISPFSIAIYTSSAALV